MENVIETIVVPEVPKVNSEQELYVYVPIAATNKKGIASYNDEQFKVKEGEVSIRETDFLQPYVIKLVNAFYKDTIIPELNKKQDKTDKALKTNDKTVVGAINEVNTNANTNTTFREIYKKVIDKNVLDIADLKDASLSGKYYVGTIEESFLPDYPYSSDIITRLNNFVISQGGEPYRNGNYIEWQYVQNGKTTLYIIAYTNAWQKPDLQAPIQKAQNERYGVIKGSTTVDGLNIDIANGEVVEITSIDVGKGVGEILKETYKEGVPVPAATDANTAEYARDGEIVDDKSIPKTYTKQTYLQEKYYDKDTSDKRFLSSAYNNIYYYSKDGLVDNLPMLSTPQFVASINAIEKDVLLFDIKQKIDFDLILTKKSSDRSNIFVSTNKDAVLRFRLVTNAIKDGVFVNLANDITLDVSLDPGRPIFISFDTIYNQLSQTEYELPKGQIFEKMLYVRAITLNSGATDVSVYCNETYASTLQLSVSSQIISYNAITKPKKLRINKELFTNDSAGGFKVDITPAMHGQPIGDYIIDCYLAKGSDINESAAVSYDVNTSTGVITVYTDYPEDYILLIATGYESASKKILTLVNPKMLDSIDYTDIGTIQITQTEQPSELILPTPKDITVAYKIFVANNTNSTNVINVNGNEIVVGNGIEFRWAGQWILSEATITTDEILDTTKNHNLTESLVDISTALNVETQNRTNADNTLQTNIDNEVIARENADKVLQNNINTEIENRKLADTELENKKFDKANVVDIHDNSKLNVYSTEQTNNEIIDKFKYNFRQLIPISSLMPTEVKNGITFTNNGDGLIKILGTNTIDGKTQFRIINALEIMPTHKYYLAFNSTGYDYNNVFPEYNIDNGSYKYDNYSIIQGNRIDTIIYTVKSKKTVDFTIALILIDLTEMFGAGNEPSSVEEVQQYLVPNKYYPYGRNIEPSMYVAKAEVNKINGAFDEHNRISNIFTINESDPSITNVFIAPANGYLDVYCDANKASIGLFYSGTYRYRISSDIIAVRYYVNKGESNRLFCNGGKLLHIYRSTFYYMKEIK